MFKDSISGRPMLPLIALALLTGALFASPSFAAPRDPETIRFMGVRMPRPGSDAARQRLADAEQRVLAGAARALEGDRAVAPGPEIQSWIGNGIPVTSSTVGQFEPDLVSDGAGGAIIGWIDFRLGRSDVFCNRLDGNGDFAASWSADALPAIVRDSFLIYCEVASDGSGGAFLTTSEYWLGSITQNDIFVQHVLGNATLSGGWPITGLSMGAGEHNGFAALSDGAGGLFVGWLDLLDQARIKRIDGSGALVSGWPAGGLPIAPAGIFDIDLEADGTGGAYFAWASNDTVFAIRYASNGTLAAGWPADGKVIAQGGFGAEGVQITRLTSGDVMAAWIDFRFFDLDLFAVRVAADATFPVPWAVNGVPVCTATGGLYDPEILSDGAGGAVIAWPDNRGGLGTAVYAQRMTGNGSIAGGWTADGVLMAPESPSKFAQAIQADGSGGVFVVWVDDLGGGTSDDIYAQRTQGDGGRPAMFPASGLLVVDANQDQSNVSMTTDGSGGSILCWEDLRDLPSAERVYAARILGDGTVSAQASLASAFAQPGLVRLTWFSPDGAAFAAALERDVNGGGYAKIADLQADGGGYVRYDDLDVVAGATYRYRLVVDESGARRILGEVTLRVPDALALAIDGARPNPGPGTVTLTFTLPDAATATLDLLDVTGRRVASRPVTAAAGRQVVRFDERLAPGVYVARLAQGGRAVSARIVVTE